MTEKYIIRVTAGSDYNIDNHIVVPVNSPEPVKISNEFIDAELNVRLEDYRGLPRNSPTTSPYFSIEPHATDKDRYSMAIRFTPKRPSSSPWSGSSSATSSAAEMDWKPYDSGATQASSASSDEDSSETAAKGISGSNLQFGNDFDHPIRDKLPPGFSYAMNIVKWWIDPGLEGDAYADMPYLYGPALSSFNTVHVGSGALDPEKGGLWFEEGGDDDGLKAREALGVPTAAKDRMKWALREENKEKWVFEYGKTYCVDFFNPYLDFSDFSLRLPGFTLPIMKYWDGQPLRYVLRNRATDDTYLVILFTLYLREDVNEDGSLKPVAIEASHADKAMAKEAGKLEDGEAKKADNVEADYEEAKKHIEKLDVGKDGASGEDDDVD